MSCCRSTIRSCLAAPSATCLPTRTLRGRDAGRPARRRRLRAMCGEDHAPVRRHAVDPLVCPWPHHLRTQARRRRRAQGDGSGREERRGYDLLPARRGCGPRRRGVGGPAPTGEEALWYRPGRDRQHADGGAEEAQRQAERTRRAIASSRPRATHDPRYRCRYRIRRGCRRWTCSTRSSAR